MVSPRIASLVVLHTRPPSTPLFSKQPSPFLPLPHALVMSIRGSCTKVILSPVLHPPFPPEPKATRTVVGRHKSSDSSWVSFLVYHGFLPTHSSRAVQEALIMSQEVSLPPAAPCRHAPYWECTGSMLVRSGTADLEWVAADGDPPEEVGRKWLLSLFFSFLRERGIFWHYNYCPSSSGQVLGCINKWGSLAVQAGVELCTNLNSKCPACIQSLGTGWVSSMLAKYFQHAPDGHFWQTEKQHSSRSRSNLPFHFVSSAWKKINLSKCLPGLHSLCGAWRSRGRGGGRHFRVTKSKILFGFI